MLNLLRILRQALSLQVSARQAVVETLERVFARHGAVPMDSNTIGFCPVDAPTDTAGLLSTTGARLAMRCCFHAFHIPSADETLHQQVFNPAKDICYPRYGRCSAQVRAEGPFCCLACAAGCRLGPQSGHPGKHAQI